MNEDDDKIVDAIGRGVDAIFDHMLDHISQLITEKGEKYAGIAGLSIMSVMQGKINAMKPIVIVSPELQAMFEKLTAVYETQFRLKQNLALRAMQLGKKAPKVFVLNTTDEEGIEALLEEMFGGKSPSDPANVEPKKKNDTTH